MFHEHCDYDVDEHELSNEHEHDEVDGRNKRIHATVVAAVVRVVAAVAQCVLNKQQHRQCLSSCLTADLRHTLRLGPNTMTHSSRSLLVF